MWVAILISVEPPAEISLQFSFQAINRKLVYSTTSALMLSFFSALPRFVLRHDVSYVYPICPIYTIRGLLHPFHDFYAATAFHIQRILVGTPLGLSACGPSCSCFDTSHTCSILTPLTLGTSVGAIMLYILWGLVALFSPTMAFLLGGAPQPLHQPHYHYIYHPTICSMSFNVNHS